MRKTELKLIEENKSIKYGDKLCFLGSCFSEHISSKLEEFGFDVDSNPLGVLFNPISIAQVVLNSEKILSDKAFLERDGIELNWYANSKVYGHENKLEFQKEIKRKVYNFNSSLKKAKTLFISFGTAFIYTHKELGIDVANCHKVEANKFTKRLLTVDEMYHNWEQLLNYLKELNPELKIVFTVSPVRHVKDGLVENNRSKSRLFELIGLLEEKLSVGYFPAYEIVNDELRDYAYFKADGVHPNEFAVQRVWDLFEQVYLEESTKKLKQELLSYLNYFTHQSIHPESRQHIRTRDLKIDQFNAFLDKHKEIKLHKKRLLNE